MAGGSEHRDPTGYEETAWLLSAALAARCYRVPLREVLDCRDGRRSRVRPACLPARRAAIYLASTGANLSCKALHRATGLSRPTLRHHLHLVEDDREARAQLDAMLDELTRRLAAAMVALSEPAMLLRVTAAGAAA